MARTLVSILNWNSVQDTTSCLARIDRTALEDTDFAVLDNGSLVDESVALRARFPDVHVMREDANLGFTGGHNKLIRHAITHGYSYVLLLNNDCEIRHASIRALSQALANDSGLAAASPLVYRSGPNRQPQMVAGWIDWADQRSVRPSSVDQEPPPGCPTLLVGTALALRCEALQQVGLLDDRYFAYYEDNDLSARLAAAGWRGAYVPSAMCLHRHRSLHEYSATALYLLSRNAWMFWRTNTPPDHRRGMNRRLLARWLYNLSILKKHSADGERVDAVLRGLLDAQLERSGPPPASFSVPWMFKRGALLAPYRLSVLLGGERHGSSL